jgi:hypothetical protein
MKISISSMYNKINRTVYSSLTVEYLNNLEETGDSKAKIKQSWLE